jgi:CPA2 family monovalent cation:H+ antiporter-2
VILLMFGVGLHFSLARLAGGARIAVPGAMLQMAVATGLGALLGARWGWPLGGRSCSASRCRWRAPWCCCARWRSARRSQRRRGRIAVGWLIVEDLAMVLALVMLPALWPTCWRRAARRVQRRLLDGAGAQDAGEGRRLRRC